MRQQSISFPIRNQSATQTAKVPSTHRSTFKGPSQRSIHVVGWEVTNQEMERFDRWTPGRTISECDSSAGSRSGSQIADGTSDSD
ncbi:MAG: hypothetical protein Ct9H300mP1_32710 [Planctomycetaceae bacterium]|nr:MAG: hypothetical protein Ct9H300mP1_32710 [Planctomycetaceae bacterium]